MKSTDLKARVDALIELATSGDKSVANANRLLEGTLTVVRAAYADDENRTVSIRDNAQVQLKKDPSSGYAVIHCITVCRGVLTNLNEEIESGLLSSLETRITGAVLSDLVALARVVIQESGDGPRNVAAVLTAAAFEDTLRRLASKNDLTPTEKLADVVIALKDAKILVGPEVGIAQSHLSFRNRALHAEWDQLDRTVVNTVLAFVEQLLLKHFA